MNQTEAFLAATLPRLREAETALHNGVAGLRMAMWSHDEPVTLFGGIMGGSGWDEIEPIFQRLGASFADCTSYEIEVDRGRCQRRPRLHGRLRAHHRRRQRRPTLGVRAACHHRVPPRGRRVESRAPSRRSVGITNRRRRPSATCARIPPPAGIRGNRYHPNQSAPGRRRAVASRHISASHASARLSQQVDEWTHPASRSTC